MAMRKFGDVEKIDVLRGAEAQVLHDHMERLSKYRLSDFTEKQKEELLADLNDVREADDEQEESSEQSESK